MENASAQDAKPAQAGPAQIDAGQWAVIEADDREVHDVKRRVIERAKRAWYAVSRPIANKILRVELSRPLKDDPVFQQVHRFLNGDGGMFKEYVYRRCEKMRPLRGARVLVPGIGYGKNLLQLAAFKPAEIVAFDLYDYPGIWEKLAAKIRAEFDVPVTFYKGDFGALPQSLHNSFDFVISDAVLEHVPDMPKFAGGSHEFLKEGGIFYASFGPLWYGPAGDHVTWGKEKLYDHLLLSKDAYDAQLHASDLTTAEHDSCDSGFMIKEGLFSYLPAKKYLDDLKAYHFDLLCVEAKIMTDAVNLLATHPELVTALNEKNVPQFDRYSTGMYIWARNHRAQ